jgi:uncharacterized protein (DUF1697 family)
MEGYVGLLRAVNVSGSGALRMADLQRTIEELGLQQGRTWLQSGNVVFRSRAAASERLERLLEERLASVLGLSTVVFVRTAEEWRRVIGANPFPREAVDDPSRLTVLFLKQPPAPALWNSLTARPAGRERIAAAGGHAYVYYPDGIGRSRLTTTFLERTLGVRGTIRNWNTVRKLGELVAGG